MSPDSVSADVEPGRPEELHQRLAVLHFGSLRPLPAPRGCTRPCLALPLAA